MTDIAPIMPDAPTRLNGTMGRLFRYFEACCATLRPDKSESPPAAKGTMMRMGLEGKVCVWAPALTHANVLRIRKSRETGMEGFLGMTYCGTQDTGVVRDYRIGG